MLTRFGRFNERGGGGGGCCPLSADSTDGGCCPLSADSTSGGGGGGRGGGNAIRFRPIQSVRCPPSRPIQSFNQWAEGAELLLQGAGAPFSPERGGPCPPLGTPLGWTGN